MRNRVRAAAALRAALGLTMVSSPERVARLLGAPPDGRHPVLRVLGLRHLAQAALLAGRPTASTVRASSSVDALHVLSCALFAVAAPDRRTPALRDGGLEACVLLATLAAGR